MIINLSPYEKDRIVPQAFGQTEMGRDLLAQDYILKQITASLIYPESKLGKEFWTKVYAQAQAKYGTTNIPINTFNKVWIVPDKAVVYENGGTAFVLENHLKVMLEQDYLSLEKHAAIQKNPVILSEGKDLNKINSTRDSSATPQNDINALGSQIIRQIVIPALTKEVNEGKNFAQLRQVFYSLILATWYKKKIKDSILNRVYSNRNKINNLSSLNASVGDPQHIYQQYLKAFKKGVYNYIKEEPDQITGQTIPKKYFSGGWTGVNINSAMKYEEPGQVTSKQLAGVNNAQIVEVSGNFDFAMTNPVVIPPWFKTASSPSLIDLLRQKIKPSDSIFGIDLGSGGGMSVRVMGRVLKKVFPTIQFREVTNDLEDVRFAHSLGLNVLWEVAKHYKPPEENKIVTIVNPQPSDLEVFIASAKRIVVPGGVVLVCLSHDDMKNLLTDGLLYNELPASDAWDILKDFTLVELTQPSAVEDWLKNPGNQSSYVFVYDKAMTEGGADKNAAMIIGYDDKFTFTEIVDSPERNKLSDVLTAFWAVLTRGNVQRRSAQVIRHRIGSSVLVGSARKYHGNLVLDIQYESRPDLVGQQRDLREVMNEINQLCAWLVSPQEIENLRQKGFTQIVADTPNRYLIRKLERMGFTHSSISWIDQYIGLINYGYAVRRGEFPPYDLKSVTRLIFPLNVAATLPKPYRDLYDSLAGNQFEVAGKRLLNFYIGRHFKTNSNRIIFEFDERGLKSLREAMQTMVALFHDDGKVLRRLRILIDYLAQTGNSLHLDGKSTPDDFNFNGPLNWCGLAFLTFKSFDPGWFVIIQRNYNKQSRKFNARQIVDEIIKSGVSQSQALAHLNKIFEASALDIVYSWGNNGNIVIKGDDVDAAMNFKPTDLTSAESRDRHDLSGQNSADAAMKVEVYDMDMTIRNLIKGYQKRIISKIEYISDGAIHVEGKISYKYYFLIPDPRLDELSYPLHELIMNAYKYSSKTNRKVILTLKREGNNAVFKIEDHGIGLSIEDLAKMKSLKFSYLKNIALFSFGNWRSKRARKYAGGGGVGYIHAKEIIERFFNGKVEVNSPGEDLGTVVTVTIPIKDPAMTEGEEPQKDAAMNSGISNLAQPEKITRQVHLSNVSEDVEQGFFTPRDYKGKVVVVAASAGGYPAIEKLITTLPKGKHPPVIITEHVEPINFFVFPYNLEGFSESIKSLKTSKVISCRSNTKYYLQENTIYMGHYIYLLRDEHNRPYVINYYEERYNYDIDVYRKHLQEFGLDEALGMPSRKGGDKRSGNVLMALAAREFGKDSIGVVLTGFGDDGREGVRKIDSEGGAVLVQSPSSSYSSDMPRSAINSGVKHEVIDIDEMSAAIMKQADTAMMVSEPKKGGIDLNPAQMSMQVKKDGGDFKFDFNGTEINAAQITGVTFSIESIEPVKDLPAILGLR